VLFRSDLAWQNADVLVNAGPTVWADMTGNAAANIGKRWQKIRITNTGGSGNVLLDAIADYFPPDSPDPGVALSPAAGSEPYPGDGCSPSPSVPGLGPYGIAGLIGLLLIGGAGLLVVRARKSTA
jgi:hypothetical protein